MPGNAPGEAALIGKIHTGIDRCNKILKDFQIVRRQLISKYVGHNWGKEGEKNRPFNEIFLTCSTLVPLLAGGEVQLEVSTEKGELAPEAWRLELGLNGYLRKRMKLGGMLQYLVLDALFGPAYAKGGIGEGGQVVEGIDIGTPYIEAISLEDRVHDPTATRWTEQRWHGNRYAIERDYVLESGLYDHTEDLQKGLEHQRTDTAKKLSATTEEDAEIAEKITLYDIWLPPGNPVGGNTGLLVTIAPQGQGERFLRVIEWHGPKRGPYAQLSFADVPDSVLPLPPGYIWQELDEFVNATARKMMRQTAREKQLTLYAKSEQADAETIRAANDGDMIGVLDPARFVQVQHGGATDTSVKMLSIARALFSQLARNADQMAGIGPSGDPTATEINTLQENAAVYINHMRGRVYEFAQWAAEIAAWGLMSNSLEPLPVEMPMGGGVVLREELKPDEMRGQFEDFRFDLKPYTLQPSTREMEVRNLLAWGQTVMPLLPMAAQQGAQLDISEFAKMLGHKMNIENIDALWRNAEPTTMEGPKPLGGQNAPMAMPGQAGPVQRPGGGGVEQMQPAGRPGGQQTANMRGQSVGQGAAV